MLTRYPLAFGVGTSPWQEDYQVLGVPWERRGKRMDEALAIVRGLSADGIARLADQGVTEVIVGFRWPYQAGPATEELQPKLDSPRRYADSAIARAG